jgi:adenylate cyclase
MIRSSSVKPLGAGFPRPGLARLRRLGWQQWMVWAIAPCVSGLAIAMNTTGLLQGPELGILDMFFRSRPAEAVDSRVTVVTISDADVSRVGKWPIPDAALARALRIIRSHQPRVIGLDLYRDLPVPPGYPALAEVFRTTPNLVGVEKRFGSQQIPPPPLLAQQGRVANIDMVLDTDGRVRRGLIAAANEQGQVMLSLAAESAVRYLRAEGVGEFTTPRLGEVHWGKAVFTTLGDHAGGYVDADTASGYQILFNFRGPQANVPTVSLSQVLNGQIPQGLLRDRVVLLGSTAESGNDLFATTYNPDRSRGTSLTPGVFLHANFTSQLLSAVLDGRPLIRVVPEWVEWLWTLGWATVAVAVSGRSLRLSWFGQLFSTLQLMVGIGLPTVGLLVLGYGLFLQGWWLPMALPMLGIGLAAITGAGFHSQRLHDLVYFDGLTQVANRRYFDQRLATQVQEKGNLALILCDVDCFKNYNDTYGHPAGDACLQAVAAAIRSAIRRNDIVARYGGEEFAVILPHSDQAEATYIAERVLQRVRELQLPHRSSTAQPYVTLSCGVACVQLDGNHRKGTPSQLIAKADAALYTAKQRGRDRLSLA